MQVDLPKMFGMFPQHDAMERHSGQSDV
jgi:hypothetical protein